ncbi:deoxycytidine monophosphate deaminase NDAI_0G02790 [Naumovozyma dairenensis CBS 421]|uniref:Deoxycytidylate deaminase n=1 Tax=Naumovozyma dairenensis (strain ATCC 10597 / BCRC 20456 / CBS 421 / NBRC 0211 / NRRL Y-12639) TaxID=1071378 RepID=G0WE45_NAUDC|nr:hypothetical protein NDAI_0G02790 [Naumovozyma dairenensis CBS 421]CCD26056.2 hypothetical protein NDAI_0G02790 [Naumovozyma dairenensis CBS 421]
MLVAITGNGKFGAEHVRDIFIKNHEFKSLEEDDFETNDEILEYATKHYKENLIMLTNDLYLITVLEKRPFFVHLTVNSSLALKRAIISKTSKDLSPEDALAAIMNEMSLEESNHEYLELYEKAHIKFKLVGKDWATVEKRLIKVVKEQIEQLQVKKNPFENVPPLRPSWDTYFMKLATLAATRSNCMKRKVGCVIVRDHRVIATGYNGTPRHLTNCFNGGCDRCNDGGSKNLNTCLCLHAEENALLEAGRDRVGFNATLYCDTCPCLTCSVKIVQSGITEVVYSQTYRMDEQSYKVLTAAGINVRQYSFIEEPRLVIV